MKTKQFTYDLNEISTIVAPIANFLEKGDIITLRGDLGAGKTTFTRALIQQLFKNDVEVLSPTFTLVQPYHVPNFTLWHFDLYRLKSVAEISEIGLQEALDEGVSVIEWPEIIEHLLPKDRLDIQLLFLGSNSREIVLKGSGKWFNILGSKEA